VRPVISIGALGATVLGAVLPRLLDGATDWPSYMLFVVAVLAVVFDAHSGEGSGRNGIGNVRGDGNIQTYKQRGNNKIVNWK